MSMEKKENPYKPGDWVKLKYDIKDDYCETWHFKGERVKVDSIAPDGEGLMFWSNLGVHWRNVNPCLKRKSKNN